MDRLGVCVIGAGGAVSSTIMAGVALMKKGLVPRHGMITETGVAKDLDQLRQGVEKAADSVPSLARPVCASERRRMLQSACGLR